MEQQDTVTSGASQTAPSREELELHLRARAWKDDAFRQELLTNPQAVLKRDYAQYFPEGQIPSELSIKVIEEEEQTLCFVLPPRSSDEQSSDFESISDEELSIALGAVKTEDVFACGTASKCVTCVMCTQICMSGGSLKKIRF